jgi:hypothetical protein
MIDPLELERAYQCYMADLATHMPEGLLEVDLPLLQQLNLLTQEEIETENSDFLNESFYVVESEEKLTLFNHKYSVWIIPQIKENQPVTYTLIALNENNKPHLEMGFTTSGVYNHSSLVLRILERFLEEIDENEKEINSWSPII